MKIAVKDQYSRKLDQQDLLRSWLHAAFPEIPLKAEEDDRSWSVKYSGVAFQLMTKKQSGWYSGVYIPTGISLSIQDEHYKTIIRKVMVKDGAIDTDDVVKKFGDLIAVKTDVDIRKREISDLEATRRASYEGIGRQVTPEFMEDLCFTNSVHDGAKDLFVYTLKLRGLTTDEVLRIAQALGRTK